MSKRAAAVSPFAPAAPPVLPAIDGVRLAACDAGLRYSGRPDLMLALLDPGTAVGGVLTRSLTAAAPVDWCRAGLAGGGDGRALVVNAGNANAFTGTAGAQCVSAVAETAAAVAGCGPNEVFVASTGVVGQALDPAPIVSRLPELALAAAPDAWLDAARAIVTTDTYPKLATRGAEIAEVPVTVNGFAKGSGMIQPDMATMLAFLFTDARLTPDAVQALCARAAEDSFNAITVDGDTSTSDTLLLFATGKAQARGCPRIEDPDDPRLRPFFAALQDVMTDLAHQVVKDGEGAGKFVAITVEGAGTKADAKCMGFAIANSPLVKTAIAGEDANWGRIVMAIGKAGRPLAKDKLRIWLGDLPVANAGSVAADYSEAAASAYMKRREIEIRVDVGIGQAAATVWTCDLTDGYISINADYRT